MPGTTFGKRLQMARRRVGITAKSLGSLIGRSERTICRYECDETEPTFDEVRQLAALCNTTVGRLLNGEPRRQRASA